jgi:hypothetical protein
VKPCAQNAMNVSLSVQVVSSTVAAAFNALVTVGEDNCTVSWNVT